MSGTRFWIGASTVGALGSAARGVRPLEVADDGSAVLGEPIDVGPNPMFLAQRGDIVAIVHELADGLVSTWRAGDETLAPLAAPAPTGAADPCHVAFDATGAFVLAANYSGSRVSAHRVGDDADAALVSAIDFTGHGPRADRQEAPHPHQVVLDPARDRVLVPDLGADRVRVLRLDADGRLGHEASADLLLHPGAGPRHLVVVDDVAIVANELDRTVSVVDLASGIEVATAPLGPDVTPRGLGASTIRMTRGGVVLVGDRDLDGVQALRYEASDRSLMHIGSLATGGRHPRDLELTADERHLVVADQGSDSLAILALDATGVPERVVATLPTEAPACVLRA
ncbi:lactonase family protein [Agromyces intestinalis]|uniref:Lactonase family protein n=1 Tax=Agromyces intestinalis TaxID=2592652 RepID=A0A5C1YHA5_9MICO|nr:beta-propeller fold lactonase family protein [Agromyces intestinalis]QEO15333.1 lactonase family protein [Agromyces intestinalis]